MIKIFLLQTKKCLFNTIIFRGLCSKTRKYVQGQSPPPNSREYFYYIDHQGMLFLNDAKIKNFTSCFKEKKFLQFFFTRLKENHTGKYQSDFPYISLCGREHNFVQCEDLPIVFTHIHQADYEYLCYGHAGELLKVKFEPENLCMFPSSGRIYHPGPSAAGGVGLVKSSLAIELSKNFVYKDMAHTEDMPIAFVWKNNTFTLTNQLLDKLSNLHQK